MIFWALRIENRAKLTHFWPKKLPCLEDIYVDNVEEISICICIRIFAHVRTIRMNGIFRIRMANPKHNPSLWLTVRMTRKYCGKIFLI